MCGRVALFTMRGKRNEGEVELCVGYSTKMDACAKNSTSLKVPSLTKKVFLLEFAAFGTTRTSCFLGGRQTSLGRSGLTQEE